MRNGIDISSFSEIVEEVTNNPREARFCYAAYATWDPIGGSLARVKPARIGTLRAPREFEIPVEPTPATQGKNMLPSATPEELAIIALSGCFLVSVVSGLTVKLCTIETLVMETALDVDTTGAHQTAARFNIHSLTDKGTKPTLVVSEMVKSVSPNYRTFSESLRISCKVGKDTLCFEPLESSHTNDSLFKPSKPLVCHWVYGTQLCAKLTGDDGKITNYPIDQPKQLGGVDWAPNPQEYLLMSLSSDVLNGLISKLSTSETMSGISVTASAHVDIRGMCGVEGVPVHLKDIELEIKPTDGRSIKSDQAIYDVLPEVIQSSRICYLLRQKMRQEELTVD